MTTLSELIAQRVSSPRLQEPAPSPQVLERVFNAAFRAPDHMMLRPWRYLIIEGERRKDLGSVFAEATRQSEMEITQAQEEKCMNMPMRAPMIIVAVSQNIPHPKVPQLEQEVATGVSVGYMLLALQSEGFNGIWRTGPMAEHIHVKQALGLQQHETLIGFLYVGTPLGELKAVPELILEDHVAKW